MTAKQKKVLYRIIIAGILFVALFIAEHAGILERMSSPWIVGIMCLIPYLIIGHDIILKAFRNIRNGQVFDENFLMMIATFGAFAVSEYIEAVAVMLFYQIGELFQSYAVGKSRQSITELMDICPEYANLEVDGHLEETDPDDVEVGAFIVIKPGERVPLDGIVAEGESFVDTSALTGESVPRRVAAGDEIISGCVNGSGTLRVRVAKEFENSTVARILELVENASSKKAKVENFITRFARYYTPFVTIAALILAILPPILLWESWSIWLERACIFLVISCPCALVISVPMGFFGGIGAASKIGVLVKGSNYLESLSEMDTIVFDKTGTLTNGVFEVTEIAAKGMEQEKLLEITALAENFSTHPIAESICKAYHRRSTEPAGEQELNLEFQTENEKFPAKLDDEHPLDVSRVVKQEEISGQGVAAKIQMWANERKAFQSSYEDRKESPVHGNGTGKNQNRAYAEHNVCTVLAGNYKLMEANRISYEKYNGAGTVVYVAVDGTFVGYLVISDRIKEGSKDAIANLKKTGIRNTVMLTGDRKEAALAVAKELGVDTVHYELLPADKVSKVETLLASQPKERRLAFVGDGINDAPVLARADIGFAMGSLGSDAAIEAADIVIMDDDIQKIARVVKISRKTMSIVKQNIVFALGVKGLILVLGAIGCASMWAAVFADVGVAIIAILNSMRTLHET
uniref:heavy metal translocating P-type ATPase n=1 Tax=Agathobacter sp. TaxID=2021311 RepID=UPI00405758FD